MKSVMRKTILIAVSAVLSACQTVDNYTGETRERITNRYEEKRDIAYENSARDRKYSNIRFEEGFFVPEHVRQPKEETWETTTVVMNSSDLTLEQLVRYIVNEAKITARFLSRVKKDEIVPFQFNGTAGEAIRRLSDAAGISYEIEGDSVTFKRFETLVKTVSLPPSVQSFRIGKKEGENDNGTGNGGFGGVQITQEETAASYNSMELANSNPSNELIKTLNILTSEDGKVAYDKSASILSVVDFPANVSSIARYIDVYNELMTTNVAFDIEFIEFRDEDGNGADINWQVANRDIAITRNTDGFGALASEFSQSIISSTAPLSLGLEILNGKYAGSQLLIDALSKQGIVYTQQEPRIYSSHNKLARIELGTDRAYAANATSNQNQTSTASSLTAGLLELGIEISVVPTVNLEKDEVYVELGIKLGDLNGIEEFSSDGTRIQLPEKDKKELTMGFSAMSNETILISGNRSNRSQFESQSSGILGALFGASKASSDDFNELLILITPRIQKRAG